MNYKIKRFWRKNGTTTVVIGAVALIVWKFRDTMCEWYTNLKEKMSGK